MKDKKHKGNEKSKVKANNSKPWLKTKPDIGTQAIEADSRFKDILYDPKYRNVSTKQTKIYIDERFKDVLTEERFSTKPILDPRGRPRSYGTKAKLDRFYSIPSSDEEETEEENEESENEESENEESEKEESEKEEREKETIGTNDSKSKSQPSDKDVEKKFRECLLDPQKDLARGELFYSDDSSDDDSTTTDEEDDDALGDFDWGELDRDAQWNVDGVKVEETNRIAVCNMDWDRIKAADLMALFSSFVSKTGAVKKVTIYPSEYGKAFIKEEEEKGPQQLAKLYAMCKKKPADDYDNLEKLSKENLDESEAPSRVELEVLRVYQRNRLRYYYAVVELDSLETATAIYQQCDRCHFETGGIILDLRYIPDDMTFDDEVPHDECSKVPEAFDSLAFETQALYNTRPTLTWDQQDERRSAAVSTLMTSALNSGDFDEDAVKEYIASSEDEESEEETTVEDGGEGPPDSKEARMAKFRALVAEIDEKERARRTPALVFEDPADVVASDDDGGDGEQSEEEAHEEENFTPFEKFLIKKKKKEKDKKKKKKLNRNKDDKGDRSGSEEPPVGGASGDQESRERKKDRARKKKGKKEPGPSDPIQGDLALLVMDDEEAEKNHFDMRKKIKKAKPSDGSKKGKRNQLKRKEVEMTAGDDFKVNTSDPRFSALFSDPTYNLDPSHPRYDPRSNLNKFVSGLSKSQNVIIADHQESKVQNDPSVNDLTMKMKNKFRKLK